MEKELQNFENLDLNVLDFEIEELEARVAMADELPQCGCGSCGSCSMANWG